MDKNQLQAGMRLAIIGAGMAGASCARMLTDAGCQVTVFEKSRGVGGRMTTRRVDWTDASGVTRQASFDHGAPGFEVIDPEFAAFLTESVGQGQIARWPLPDAAGGPAVASGGARAGILPGSGAGQQWVATPDMPALCRSLLAGLTVHTGQTVQSLQRTADGWCVTLAEGGSYGGFDALLLAIPPLQAAALLEQHQPAWAQQAAKLEMLPDWTLMAISGVLSASTDTPPCATPAAPAARRWPVALADGGPLAMIVRNDSKPGRTTVPGLTHWVAHASTAWSQAHLETAGDQVQLLLQRALADWLGEPVPWQYATVHRWRYATLASGASSTALTHRWDGATRIGVCGDAWSGGGVQGAWSSARALCQALLAR